jgi:hypothetical protein
MSGPAVTVTNLASAETDIIFEYIHCRPAYSVMPRLPSWDHIRTGNRARLCSVSTVF